MFQNLLKLLPPLRGALTVKLTGIHGFSGRGSVRFFSTDAGGVLTVSLNGLAGISADIFSDDEIAVSVPITNGRADATFSSAKGDKLPMLQEGAHIEIRQNGDVVLSGVLARS